MIILTAMSRKLGTTRQGAFAVYIADTDEWHIRIGEESRAAFLGRTPPADVTQRELAMRRAAQQFLTQARHDTDGFIAWADAHAQPGQSADPGAKSQTERGRGAGWIDPQIGSRKRLRISLDGGPKPSFQVVAFDAVFVIRQPDRIAIGAPAKWNGTISTYLWT